LYEKDGEKYFVVDGHVHYWDASPENWIEGQEQYAKGWIECFYGYHQLGPLRDRRVYQCVIVIRDPRGGGVLLRRAARQ
jgi:hypothetical protein